MKKITYYIYIILILYVNVLFAQSDTTKYYNNQGLLTSAGILVKGKKIGEWKYYDNELGFLIKIENYEDESLHGSYKEFYKNGQIKVSGAYDKDVKIEKKEKSIGKPVEYFYVTYSLPINEWTYYNEEGKIAKTVMYSPKGKLLKTKGKK